MTAAANQAAIIAAMGASGSGKSLFVKGDLRRLRPPRLLIWSPLEDTDQYAKHGRLVDSMTDLRETVRAPRFSLVYQPGGQFSSWPDQFDALCQIAFTLGNVVLVVEELGDVTKPHQAPEWWSRVTRQGRHRGMRVYGTSQRPAAVDKNFFSNASMVRSGRLNHRADVQTLAAVLRVKDDEVGALKPLEFIQRDMLTGVVSRGKVQIRSK